MAASLQSLLLALDNGGTSHRSSPTCPRPSLERRMDKRRRRRIFLEGSRKSRGGAMKRRVRALRKLVPAGESVGLDGLFREAADYIACLRMKVEVMQVMVRVLSGDSDE